MLRTMRMAAFALTVTLALSGFAFARDDDDRYYRQGNFAQAQQYGYENGYRDGVEKGRHEGRERDRYDYQTPDWRHAKRGYKGWMGPVYEYQRAYQEGYSNGFRSGYRDTTGRREDGYRNGWRFGGGRGGSDGYGYGEAGGIAYRLGQEDGASMAREDIEHRKSYNSKPRGRFGDRDRGYRREYGDKDRYKAEYADGYRAGYDAEMRRGY